MSATWEEARRCSRCHESGESRGGKRPTLRAGVFVVLVYCRTESCSWFDTAWPVQINEDGSIPDAAPAGTARGEKQFGTEQQLHLPPGTTNAWVDAANKSAAGMDRPGVKELGT
jgi:hypothetical protein